ncbi:MAG TPA: type 2 lanthipeptide synthetase LanM, partial [Kofleriaceae bacterium]|nr:type 2 lanthipeptide synthetase LanM [Kofleriaceae bacterium]
RASLAAHQINLYGPDAEAAPALGVTPSDQVDPERFLAAAAAVGDRLDELALKSGDEATWIGLHSTQGRDWRLTPLGRDLYSGLPGVAVFLAQLAALTGEARHQRLARAAWSTVWNQRAAVRDIIHSIGGFDGHGGMLWALVQLERLWGGGELAIEAHAVVERMRDLVVEDEAYDVLAGAAGAIAGLLALHRAVPSDQTLAVAVACGEHLLERARPMARGAAWLSPAMKRIAAEPLTGFAHGAAGCGWALLELAAATGDDRFRRAALDAFEYERGLFEPELGTWREVRHIERSAVNVAVSQGDDIYMLAWCHGAPGIGLSRLRALRHRPDPELHAEAAVAIESTLARGFDRSHCLCHGDLGNAEVLLEAAAVLDDAPRWRAKANRAGGRVLESIATHGWRSGLPRGVEVPGLMTGLAGIGYGFLRLARPALIPSVLLLDPPVPG